MADSESDSDTSQLSARRQRLEEHRFEAETEKQRAELNAKKVEQEAQSRQASFERRYRLLELRERRADRALKAKEIEVAQGAGLRFTPAQATVAAAAIALVSAFLGYLVQGWFAQNVEATKSQALISVEELKARGNLELEARKQQATERLERAKFETTLILKATEAAKREDQIRNLKFFLNAGFIGDPEGKIAQMSEGAYPSLPPPPTVPWSDIPASMRSIRPQCVITFSAEPPTFGDIVKGLADLIRKPPLSVASTQITDRGYYQIVTEVATLPLYGAQLNAKNISITVSKTSDEKRFFVDAVLPLESNNYVLLGLNDYFAKMGASTQCPGAPADWAGASSR